MWRKAIALDPLTGDYYFMPRPVAGPGVLQFADRVVIPCTKSSFVSFAAAGGRDMDDFPGAGSDCLGCIEWFRQLKDPAE